MAKRQAVQTNPSKVPGLSVGTGPFGGTFTGQKYIGEVAFDEDGELVDDEVTHVSFYEARYGSTKIIAGYVQVWGEGPDGKWTFQGSLDSERIGNPFYEGDWYGDDELAREIGKALGIEDLEWTEAGMQSGIHITLTRPVRGWF